MKKKIRAKKSLGQHFLNDELIAEQIVDSIDIKNIDELIEIGPGMGVLSEFLLEKDIKTTFIELDNEAVDYLKVKFPEISDKIINKDFLKIDIENNFKGKLGIIGNFPYNISSQILFKVYDNKDKVFELVGMFQKEVGARVASKPGNRVYGILSVLIQAYYDVEYLFTVGPEEFNPPPKIQSGVIRLVRKENTTLNCDSKLFKTVIKAGFNQRRKTLRNSLKGLLGDLKIEDDIMSKRPEQLGFEEFVELTNIIDVLLKANS